jgi:hypothetical protein
MTIEEKKAYRAAWREENKERIATYRVENKEHIAALQAEYGKKNKQRLATYQAAYREENKERLAASAHVRGEKRRLTLRTQFYDRYGLKKEGHEHGVCTCCKERDLMMFGTISHIDGGGAQHRKLVNGNGIKIFKDALAVYDPSRFAAECACCNMAAEKYGRDAVIAYFDKKREAT